MVVVLLMLLYYAVAVRSYDGVPWDLICVYIYTHIDVKHMDVWHYRSKGDAKHKCIMCDTKRKDTQYKSECLVIQEQMIRSSKVHVVVQKYKNI